MSWFVIAALIAANALYVAAEFSAVAAQRGEIAKLAENGNRRAHHLLEILRDGAQLDRYIAACQIGITLTSLVVGAYGQATIAVSLEPWLGASTAALVVLFALTTLQVVLGELLPKSLALQFPERTALLTFVPTRWSAKISRGFIWLLNGSGFLLLKPFGVKPGGHEHVHSPEEVGILIAESSRGGTLSPEASQRLQSGLRLSQLVVRDIMVPRDEIYGIDISTSPEEISRRVLDSPYSRIVVYRGTLDHVLGTVAIKDLVGMVVERGSVPPLAELIKPLPSVPETERTIGLVELLKTQQASKALVVDHANTVRGFVSVDDVLGEVFGELDQQEAP